MVSVDDYLRHLHVTVRMPTGYLNFTPVFEPIEIEYRAKFRPFEHSLMVPCEAQLIKGPALDPADWARLFHDEWLRAMPVTPWET